MQEELTNLNINAPNTGTPRYIKQVFNNLQRDLDSHTIMVGDFNTPLSVLDRSMRQKINGYAGLELRSGPRGTDRHIQNSSPENPQIIRSSQHHIALTLRLTTSLEVNHSSTNAKIPRNHNNQSLRPQCNQIRTQD